MDAGTRSRRGGPKRGILVLLALGAPLLLAWWLQGGETPVSVREDDRLRADVRDEIAALPEPRGEARFVFSVAPHSARYRLEIEMRNASPAAAAVTGIPDDELERGILSRNRRHLLIARPEGEELRLILTSDDDEGPRAHFLVAPRGAAIRFAPDHAPRPPAAGRSAARWLAAEPGLLWPASGDDDLLATHEMRPLDPEIESFKAAQVRRALQVEIRARDRREGGYWFDEEGAVGLLAYASAVLDGPHWQGRQETALRGRLARGTGLTGLTGVWETEERCRLRRDAPTTAVATHRIVVKQRILLLEDKIEDENGR